MLQNKNSTKILTQALSKIHLMLAFPPICLIICSVSVTHTQLFCEPFKDILHVMVLYPQILQCIFPKTRNILFHNHSAVINFIIHFDVFHLIQSTIHILILPVDLILSFVAFPPTQYRIQSRMRYYNQLSHLFNLLYLEHFPQPFFLFYYTNILKEYSLIPTF